MLNRVLRPAVGVFTRVYIDLALYGVPADTEGLHHDLELGGLDVHHHRLHSLGHVDRHLHGPCRAPGACHTRLKPPDGA